MRQLRIEIKEETWQAVVSGRQHVVELREQSQMDTDIDMPFMVIRITGTTDGSSCVLSVSRHNLPISEDTITSSLAQDGKVTVMRKSLTFREI